MITTVEILAYAECGLVALSLTLRSGLFLLAKNFGVFTLLELEFTNHVLFVGL